MVGVTDSPKNGNVPVVAAYVPCMFTIPFGVAVPVQLALLVRTTALWFACPLVLPYKERKLPPVSDWIAGAKAEHWNPRHPGLEVVAKLM
jgi:hypothetical protein